MFKTHPVSLVGIDPRFKLSTVEIIVKVKQRTKSKEFGLTTLFRSSNVQFSRCFMPEGKNKHMLKPTVKIARTTPRKKLNYGIKDGDQKFDEVHDTRGNIIF